MIKLRFLGSLFILASFTFFTSASSMPEMFSQADNPNPPDQPVKLIFIHHSCGENWLTDGYGNLGRELGRNNYFVSDTNYGWGPDYIGDRTDIPNWMEWFRSNQTPTIMAALLRENGQNSSYTRSLRDPGGENQIIMFKSCFPNSDLAGSPNDPPGTYEELSVSGAKYVYNELLKYFASRTDKLFVAITAPPLIQSGNAANARAFNQWLANDWLTESNYTQGNVAVFDFYNVLTSPDAHHRYSNGQIEYTISRSNTLAYPTGDDHPSEKGSQKATEEFIPLLNIYYNRWKANAPYQAPAASLASDSGDAETAGMESESSEPQSPATAPQAAAVIDDFNGGNPQGTNGWEPYWDEATQTSMRCDPQTGTTYDGSGALELDFDVAANSWATCALYYGSSQDWQANDGLTFYLHASQPGLVFDVDVYAGSQDAQETYLYTIEAPAESADGWVPISLAWGDFHRADWEENAGAAFEKPDEIIGLAFGMGTFPDTPNTGKLWMENLSLMGSDAAAEAAPVESGEMAAEELDGKDQPRRRGLPCGGGMAAPLAFIGLNAWSKRKKTQD